MNDSPPLRILIALQYYVPHRTGLTLHVQRLAESLAVRGHEVTVMTARYDKTLARDETVNGVRIIRLWAPIRVSRGMVMPAYLLAATRLIQQHDVVSIHSPMLETALVAWLCKLLGKPLVITHHGDLVLPDGALNRVIEAIVFWLYKMGARQAYRIVAYSHDYADYSSYVRPFREKTSVIYPPNVIPLPNPTQIEELRATWSGQANGDGPLIGYAGRFVEEKRPDLLIRALPTIHETFPQAKIVFAGEYLIKYEDFYERNADLVERFRDHLVFLGLLKSPQTMADFYATCDVLVLPSDTECLGLVQTEAMLCGTPVVVTDTPGAREAVRTTGMGLIVPPRNPQALAEGILTVLSEPGRFIKTREAIEEAYSLEETVGRNERLFRESLS